MSTLTEHTTHPDPAVHDSEPAVHVSEPPPGPALHAVPDDDDGPGIDARLVDRVLDVLSSEDPAAVLARFPANPVAPPTKGNDRKDLIRNLAQFRSHVLDPGLAVPGAAGRIVDLAGRLIDHLNTLPRVAAVDGEDGGKPAGKRAAKTVDSPDVSAWIIELTSWIERAAADDERLVDRLFESYSRRVDDLGLDGLFGDELDFYVTHRDGTSA